MELFQVDKLILFILFFIPGFISIKVWRLLKPADIVEPLTNILEAISYSCVNYAILFPLLIFLLNDLTEFSWVKGVLMIIVLFICPIIWPILYSWFVDSSFLQGRIKHPIPKAWDYFFSRGEVFFALVHLNDGDMIAGYFGSKSFASSYPAEDDVYFEKVWNINEKGVFLERSIEGTKGFLVNKSAINYMEFFGVIKEDVNNE